MEEETLRDNIYNYADEDIRRWLYHTTLELNRYQDVIKEIFDYIENHQDVKELQDIYDIIKNKQC